MANMPHFMSGLLAVLCGTTALSLGYFLGSPPALLLGHASGFLCSVVALVVSAAPPRGRATWVLVVAAAALGIVALFRGFEVLALSLLPARD